MEDLKSENYLKLRCATLERRGAITQVPKHAVAAGAGERAAVGLIGALADDSFAPPEVSSRNITYRGVCLELK